MDPRHLYFDERLNGGCAYCGGQADTRDHVPSRVLMDKPYPSNLPVVGACNRCNNGFSRHERMVACLVDCAMWGGTEAPELRPKVRRMLTEDGLLAREVQCVLHSGAARLAEHESVGVVVNKLANGHHSYLEFRSDVPISAVRVATRLDMGEEHLSDFEQLPGGQLFPEIGTRGFVNAVKGLGGPPQSGEVSVESSGWTVVQPGRYRYAAIHYSRRTALRFVLSEYLYCEVSW